MQSIQLGITYSYFFPKEYVGEIVCWTRCLPVQAVYDYVIPAHSSPAVRTIELLASFWHSFGSCKPAPWPPPEYGFSIAKIWDYSQQVEKVGTVFWEGRARSCTDVGQPMPFGFWPGCTVCQQRHELSKHHRQCWTFRCWPKSRWISFTINRWNKSRIS